MSQPTFNLDNTVKSLLELKTQRAKFIKPIDDKIKELESSLLENVNQAIDGSKTTNGELYKVTVTNRINRTLDKTKLFAAELSDVISSAFSADIKLNLGNYRALMDDPKAALELSEFVTEKPGKPSIKLDIKGVN